MFMDGVKVFIPRALIYAAFIPPRLVHLHIPKHKSVFPYISIVEFLFCDHLLEHGEFLHPFVPMH